MSLRRAYVDSSCLVAVAFEEPGAERMRARLAALDVLLAHPLVEAEVRSVCARERRKFDVRELENITWIVLSRRITVELERVFAAGFARGADAFHLACALYVAPVPDDITFLTLDTKQRTVAKALGFKV
ncbi:MAG: type II toxin-antitoxin system VapC family toxin [Gemmatimonadetes bacterium]|nr:type II toxin-antitoxin system VapC family toxin [Gemmatimonadota bacterium]